MKELDVQGVWWRANAVDQKSSDESVPDEATAGILSFDPADGGQLELIGSWEGIETIGQESPPDVGRIYGISTDGDRMTLDDCRFSGSSGNSGRGGFFRTESYGFSRVYIGDFISEDDTFFRVSLSFQNLSNWTDLRRIETPGDHRVPPGPAVTEEAVLDDAEVILHIWEDVESVFPMGPSRTFLNVYPDDPLTIMSFTNHYLRHFQNFFTLGVGEAVFPTSMTVYSDPFGHRDSRITVHQRIPFYERRESENEVAAPNMNFTLQDINFNSAVVDWFDSIEACEDLHNKYFGQIYNSNMFIGSKLLSLVVGLERYHRDTYPVGKHMSNEIWNRVRKSIMDQMPPVRAKERAGNVLQSIGNDYSLGARLRDIGSTHYEVISAIVDVRSAAGDIRDARIDLAHGLDNANMDGNELVSRKRLTEIFATACLLDIAGVSTEMSIEILQTMTIGYDIS